MRWADFPGQVPKVLWDMEFSNNVYVADVVQVGNSVRPSRIDAGNPTEERRANKGAIAEDSMGLILSTGDSLLIVVAPVTVRAPILSP